MRGAHLLPNRQGKPAKRCYRPWIIGAVLLVTGLLALWSLTGAPQGVAQDSTTLRAEPFGAEPLRGSPQGETWTTYANGDDVRALALKDGQVWAGTRGGGAVRWDPADGSYVQYLRPQDGLAGNDVRDVAVGPDGRLWFATDRGVSVLSADGQSWATYDRANTDGGLTSDNVTAIAVSADGTAWVGAAQYWDGDEWVGGGVSRLQGDSWTHYSIANGLPSSNVTDIAVDPQSGEVWVTTRPYRRYEVPTATSPGGWKLRGGGVAVYKAGAWTPYVRSPGVPGSFPSTDFVNCVAIDFQGRKWFGLAGAGLNVLDGSAWYQFSKAPNGLRENHVLAIAVDPLDRVWAATAAAGDIGSGVSVLNHRGTLGDTSDDVWVHYTAADGLASDTVRAIIAESADRAWFGTSDPQGDGYGVSRLEGGTWSTFAMADRGGLPSNLITALAFDGLGRPWVGTERRGIAILDAGNWLRHTKASTGGGLPSDHVTGLAFDPGGRLWVATEGVQFDYDLLRYVDGGVAVYDGAGWRVYNLENTARRGDVVTTVAGHTLEGANQVPAHFPGGSAADAAFESGYLMIGDDPTLYGYLSYNEFLRAIQIVPVLQRSVLFGTPIYSVDLGVANNRLSAIAVGEGRVWVGAGRLVSREGFGLSVFDLGSQTWETIRYPTIASNLITEVAVDQERHRVWLAASYWDLSSIKGGGISVYNGAWTNYDQANSGLLAYRDDVRSIAVGLDGEAWIGTFDFGGYGYSAKSAVDAVVNRFQDDNWSHWMFEEEGFISSIAVDQSGRVWAATSRERQGPGEDDLQQPYGPLGGVRVLSDGRWSTYNVDNSGLASDDVRRIAIDSEGRCWFASYRHGLSALAGCQPPPPGLTPTPTLPAPATRPMLYLPLVVVPPRSPCLKMVCDFGLSDSPYGPAVTSFASGTRNIFVIFRYENVRRIRAGVLLVDSRVVEMFRHEKEYTGSGQEIIAVTGQMVYQNYFDQAATRGANALAGLDAAIAASGQTAVLNLMLPAVGEGLVVSGILAALSQYPVDSATLNSLTQARERMDSFMEVGGGLDYDLSEEELRSRARQMKENLEAALLLTEQARSTGGDGAGFAFLDTPEGQFNVANLYADGSLAQSIEWTVTASGR